MMNGWPEAGSVENWLASKPPGTTNMTWAGEVTQSSPAAGAAAMGSVLLGSLPPINRNRAGSIQLASQVGCQRRPLQKVPRLTGQHVPGLDPHLALACPLRFVPDAHDEDLGASRCWDRHGLALHPCLPLPAGRWQVRPALGPHPKP